MPYDTLELYLQRFVRHPHPLLATLEADAVRRHVPIIGPWAAQILALLASSMQAQQILELGTATGYSAIWLAMAVADWRGEVVTVEQDATRVYEARQHFHAAAVHDRVRIMHGAALAVLHNLTGPFDVVFVDILWYLRDAAEAERLRDACVQQLRPGGLLVCDNALRGGSILQPVPESAALGVKTFTEAMLQDPRFDTVLIPIRDGLLVCRRH
jgi:predicted O-methyltransferase YrrM